MALEAVLIVASFLVGVVVYREAFYLSARRSGMRLQVDAVRDDPDGSLTTVTIRNAGSKTERDVLITVFAGGIPGEDLRVEIVLVESHRPRHIFVVERMLDPAQTTVDAYRYLAPVFAPDDRLTLKIEASIRLSRLQLRVAAVETSDAYELVSDGGGGDFIAMG